MIRSIRLLESVTARTVLRPIAAAAVLAVAAGCTSSPLSFLNDRQVYHPTVLYRYPVFVSAVDGTSTSFRPVPITAGDHLVKFDAPPVGGFTQSVQKIYPMRIEPCTRYYVAAQRRSSLTQDWELVVERTFQVAGCDPQQELEKARREAAAGHQPPLSSAIESATTIARAPADTPGPAH